MSSLDLLETTEQSGGLYGAQYVPKDAWDIMSEGATSMALPTSLGKFWDKRSVAERDAEISKRFGKPIDEMIGLGTIEALAYREKADDVRNTRLDAMIQEGRKKADPQWKDIKTTAELRDEVSLLGKEQEAAFGETIAQANSTKAKVLGLGGAALSSVVTDPINLATLPFGAASGMGILRAMGTEALINSAIEAAEIPLYKAWADRVGRKYGVEEAAMDVATAGFGAGAIVGTLKGIGKAYSLARGESMQRLDKIAAAQNVPSEARDAAKYMSRVAHVDEEIPFPDIGKVATIENRQALDETRKAFFENRAPEYSKISEKFSRDLEEPDNIKLIEKERTVYKADGTVERKPMLVVKGQMGTPIRKPRDIIDFIISKGGIKTDDANIGDVKDFDLKAMNKGNKGVLLRKNGGKLDDLRESAVEAGYLPEGATVPDLLNAIDSSARGTPVFSTKDAAEVADFMDATASNAGNDVLDNETYQVYEALKRRGTTGVTSDEMRAIAEKHLKSDSEDTLDDTITDYLERQGMKEYDGLTVAEAKTVKASQINTSPVAKTYDEVNRILEEIEKPEVMSALEAQYRQLVKDFPDETILTENGEVKLSDLMDEFEDAEAEVTAVKSCGLK